MDITQRHVSNAYGPLGSGRRYAAHAVPDLAYLLQLVYPQLTDSAAKSLCHHLHRLGRNEPQIEALEALDAVGEDFGMEVDSSASIPAHYMEAMAGTLRNLLMEVKRFSKTAAAEAKKLQQNVAEQMAALEMAEDADDEASGIEQVQADGGGFLRRLAKRHANIASRKVLDAAARRIETVANKRGKNSLIAKGTRALTKEAKKEAQKAADKAVDKAVKKTVGGSGYAGSSRRLALSDMLM